MNKTSLIDNVRLISDFNIRLTLYDCFCRYADRIDGCIIINRTFFLMSFDDKPLFSDNSGCFEFIPVSKKLHTENLKKH